MGDSYLVAAAFQHSFHAETGIVMVVNQQDAPVICNSGIRFPIAWSIVTLPIALNGAFNGVQLDCKSGALIFPGAFDANVSAMRVDQRLRNGQTQPESSKPAGDITLSLFKCVKNFVDCFGLDTNASVRNANLNFVLRWIQSFDANLAFFRCELDAVFDQVPKNLLQACWIAFDVTYKPREVQSSLRGLLPRFRHDISRKRAGGFDGWK